jgi:uncharacterized membrane protein YobD (UPF0266 family)
MHNISLILWETAQPYRYPNSWFGIFSDEFYSPDWNGRFLRTEKEADELHILNKSVVNCVLFSLLILNILVLVLQAFLLWTNEFILFCCEGRSLLSSRLYRHKCFEEHIFICMILPLHKFCMFEMLMYQIQVLFCVNTIYTWCWQWTVP